MLNERTTGFWRKLWQRSTILDRLTLGYVLAFAIALALLGREDKDWIVLFLAHVSLSAIIIAIIHFWHDQTTGARGFIRQLYPGLLYAFFYREMHAASFWVFPRFLDAELVAFERAVFGTDPNVWIVPAQSTWLNEIMMAGYFSYYLLIPIVALPLFFKRRLAEVRGLLTATTLAFVMSYVGFVLFPVEGPRHFLADQFPAPLSGGFFVPLVSWIIGRGAIHGGCMPSSHVAVALVVLVWAWKTMPNLGRALAPFVAVLCVATVWGRFHYVTDIMVGLIVGVVALVLSPTYAPEPNPVVNDLPRGEPQVQTAGTR